MATPCEGSTRVDETKLVRQIDDMEDKKHESRQLLYPEKFGECYREKKLQIVGNSKPPASQLKTHKLPECSVLSQIKAFLPEMSKSNQNMAKDLKTRPEMADVINIECIDHNEASQHIEMSLSMVPSILISHSEEDSSSESSSDESSHEEQDGNVDHCDCSSSTDKNSLSLSSPSLLTKSKNKRLKLPKSSKTTKNGKSLIEEIRVVEEDQYKYNEEFTNR